MPLSCSTADFFCVLTININKSVKTISAENNNDKQLLWSTIEPADLVQSAYPDLVERFLEAKATKINKASKKKPSTRKAATVEGDKKTNTAHPKSTSKSRKQAVQSKPVTPVLINRFLQRISSRRKPAVTKYVASPKISTSSDPMDLSMFSFSADDSSWTKMDEDSANLSAVINGMVEQPPSQMEFCGRRLRFDAVDSHENQKENENSLTNPASTNRDTENRSFVKVVKDSLCELISSTSRNKRAADSSIKNPAAQLRQSSVQNESFDEFDLLVMGTAGSHTKIIQDNSSTPIVRKRISSSCNLSPVIANPTSIASPMHSDSPDCNNLNVSHFFVLNLTSDTDQFERSIDYRNMPDEFPDENRPVKHILQRIAPQSAPSTPIGSIQDSFNLNGYIPIGKKLRKQLSS